MTRENWTGTCEWCGEPDTTLICNNELPEWTEGVACLVCEKMMLDEAERIQRIGHDAEMDILENNMLFALNAHSKEPKA